MKSTTLTLIAGLFLAPQFQALAADHSHDGHAGHAMSAGQAMDTAWADGTIKKINADAGKVTISHGPLANLDMPAMTMVFRVKDPAWLSQIKPGDRIRFIVERQDGALTVTALQLGR
jgi:Cu(I)/Ag(I) efflux system protein CusF